MDNFSVLAVEALEDERKMEDFISQHEAFILKCASSISNKYISKSDDEWSIALSAFNRAIENYDINKGSFYSFAELYIRSRLIDYFRSQSRFKKEIMVGPEVFNSESDEEQNQLGIQYEVLKKVSNSEQDNLKLEIEAITQCLSSYGFSFHDLVKCSPKAEKTKKSCAKAVNYLLENPLLIHEMQTTKLLPVKTIKNNTRIPRKTIDRHRKYIIAAVEILYGDYPGLQEYMQFIREEKNK